MKIHWLMNLWSDTYGFVKVFFQVSTASKFFGAEYGLEIPVKYLFLWTSESHRLDGESY